jgi:hypothetical protein
MSAANRRQSAWDKTCWNQWQRGGFLVLEVEVEDRLQPVGAQQERETERILLAAVRAGQHVFARSVLANWGNRCVFCGFAPPATGKRLLLAGHIKPSSPRLFRLPSRPTRWPGSSTGDRRCARHCCYL